jgi:diacylglycerol kinase family enzyme
MRYSAINSGPGLLAMIVHKATPLKGTIGQAAYPVAGLKAVVIDRYQADNMSMKIELCKGAPPMEIPKWSCIMSSINNGRFGGGLLYLTPCALLNDGLMDIMVFKETPSACTIIKMV